MTHFSRPALGMEDSPDLEALIARAREGDQTAMTELFDKYRDRLRRMIRLRMDRRVQARVDESDVLQEAYVDLATQLPNYARSPDLPFFLWLRLITGQRLAKTHRFHLGQQKRDVNLEVNLIRKALPDASSVFIADALVGNMTSPSGKASREEVLLLVQRAIEGMSDIDREVIALRYIEQLSNAEAAVVLELPEEAARKRHTRAIRRLQQALKDVPGAFE